MTNYSLGRQDVEIKNLKKELHEVKLVVKYLMSRLNTGTSTKEFSEYVKRVEK